MRIGVFGGTFDPIHYGHLVAAEEVRHELDLTRVLFVPARVPPHKLDEEVTPPEHRLAMVERATTSNPHFAVSEVDLGRPGPSYTVDTVQLLREREDADAEWFFIMGIDSLAEILTWHRPQQLIALCRLAVVNRPEFEADLEALEADLPGISERVDFVSIPQLGISSTELTRRVREGRPIKYQVPPSVEAYVYEHGLYGS